MCIGAEFSLMKSVKSTFTELLKYKGTTRNLIIIISITLCYVGTQNKIRTIRYLIQMQRLHIPKNREIDLLPRGNRRFAERLVFTTWLRMFVCLSVFLFACLFVCLYVCLSAQMKLFSKSTAF